jgi:hypothetical protein
VHSCLTFSAIAVDVHTEAAYTSLPFLWVQGGRERERAAVRRNEGKRWEQYKAT